MEELNQFNPELSQLLNNKEDGYNYRERRQEDWEENYTLYRDRVIINRLTQRQSVNLPLMKQTVRTLLKDVDDMPVLYFENLDNDKEKEVFLNEYWKWTAEQNCMEIADIVDKKQVFLFGRSFDQWQIVDGKVKMTITDPQDILVSRYCDPVNVNTSSFLIHTHIFKRLTDLEEDESYDKEAIARLKKFYASEDGLIKVASNQKMMVEKNKKMSDMGLDDVESPVLGETWVELTQHFFYPTGSQELWLYTEVDDQEIIFKKPLEELMGVTKDHYWKTHYPYNSWADDLERQDFWSDGIADIVRTPNKVLNSWISQLVENRTLRNFGMHYYDSTVEGFNPSTFQPIPWGWYGMPGKPSDMIQKVDIPDLSESLDEMTFMIGMIEKATGATATQQGVQTERQVTLGEVQLALGEAKERVKGMSKFYTPAWKRRGEIFLKLIEGSADKLDAVKVYKKGRNTDDVYEREISPQDWMSKSGYQSKVWSQDEKETNDTKNIERINAVRVNIPGNQKLEEIYKRKLLEFGGFKPDEINEIMALEQQKLDQMQLQSGLMGGMPMGGQVGQPAMQPQVSQVPPTPTKPVKKKANTKKVTNKLENIKAQL
jgi:hypothetical protein